MRIIATSDLGLSGPVVADMESYWPAKSQVTYGMFFQICKIKMQVKISEQLIVTTELK